MLTQRPKGAKKPTDRAVLPVLCAFAPLREVSFVLFWIVLFVGFPATLHAQNTAPLVKRVDDATRAKLLAALTGLVILGFGLVLLAWLGARVVERYRRGTSFFRPTPRP